MDYWALEGRSKILTALEAVCDTVEKDLATVIRETYQSRHASLLEEIRQLRAVAARNDQLERENQSLVRELAQLRDKNPQQNAKSAQTGHNAQQAARPVLAEVSANRKAGVSTASSSSRAEKPDLGEMYSSLTKRYTALREQYEKTQRAARKYRDSQLKWVKYADSLEAKIKRLEKKLQHDEGDEGRLQAASSARKLLRDQPTDIASDGPRSNRIAPTLGLVPNAEPTPEPRPVDIRSAASTPAATGPETGHREDGVAVDEGTLSDMKREYDLPPLPPCMDAGRAVVIKQEPSSDGPIIVSERTLRKRKHNGDEPETRTPSRKIKREGNLSSDPVITGEAVTFSPHESIDLDGDREYMPTPRKQRPSERRASGDEEAPVQGVNGNSTVLHRSRAPAANSAAETPAPPLGTHRDHSPASLLSPRKPARASAGSKPSIGLNWTLDGAIADVAEEAFESFLSPRPLQGGGDLPTHLPLERGRLHSLLNRNSPEQVASVLRTARYHRDSPESSTKACPDLRAKTVTPVPKHAQDKSGPTKGSRLRDRPLAELGAEDFKVNPKFNDGYKHAFTEVVRNKGERAELSGCIDPACCGKQFRALAESELGAGGPGVLSREADIKMVEDYLGNKSYLSMTLDQQQEVWLKAKTQDLANRYGRHRQRYARRPSPPGFWNPDFPSTQEIAKSKEEAEKIERSVVEERWREAMRGGGRWLFRDE